MILSIFTILCIAFNLLFPQLFVLILAKTETSYFVFTIKPSNDTNYINTSNHVIAVRFRDQHQLNAPYQINTDFTVMQKEENETIIFEFVEQLKECNIFGNMTMDLNLTEYTDSNSRMSDSMSYMFKKLNNGITHLFGSNGNEANMNQIQITSHQNDRVYHSYSDNKPLIILLWMFGFTQNTKTNGIILLSITTILSVLQPYCVDATNWTLITSPPIPNQDMYRAIGYDSNNHLVWMLGGYHNAKQVISFDTINGTYTDYGATLTADIMSWTENYVEKDSHLYISYGYKLYKYDLTNITSNLQILSSLSVDGVAACLSVVDNYLILTRSLDVFIYNINNNTWINPPNTPSMNNSRTRHSCQVSSSKQLYVVGGRNDNGVSMNSIEKLDVSDIPNINNYHWILLIDTLSNRKDLAATIIFNDFIYYMGGYQLPSMSIYNGVDVIDTKNDTVSSFIPIYEPEYGAAAVMISHTIYVFGGNLASLAPLVYTTYYQYYTLPTNSPTNSPTKSPTSSPSFAPTSSCNDYNGKYSDDGNDETNFDDKNVINMGRYLFIDKENTKIFVPSPSNLEVNCIDSDCLVKCNKSTSCLLSNIDIYNSTNGSIVVLCDSEFACSKARISTTSMVSMNNITIICSDKYSCINMEVNVSNISSMNIYCIEYQSCFDMIVKIDIINKENNMTNNETNDGIISCISLNSCDNLLITTNSNKTQLFMYQYSEDVILNNGIGYLHEAENIICNDHRYIRYETAHSLSTTITDYLSSLILNEYDNTNPLLPCDGVSVECGNYSCNMFYSMDIPSDLDSLSNGCYWIPLQELIDIKCDGDCITSPTKSPTIAPSNMPTESTSNPTNAPTQSPSIAPSDNPTETPSFSPSKSPSRSPSIVPSQDPTETPSFSPTETPSNSPTTAPTRFPTQNMYKIYNAPIDITYVLENLEKSNVDLLENNTISIVEKIREMIERNYFIALHDTFDIEYKHFSININDINGYDLSNVYLKVNEKILLNSQIMTNKENAQKLIEASKSESFRQNTENDLIYYFKNNTNLYFYIKDKDYLTISIQTQSSRGSFIVIYISIFVLSSGLLTSCLILFLNKKENSKIDNAKWMAPFLFSFQIYDFVSDINLSYDILTNPLSYKGDNKINIIFWCGIFSLVFTVVPYITNLVYGIRIKKQKIIASNNRADTYFTDKIAVLIGLIVISGGCYPALLLTSSRIFNLDVFTSGLSKHELNKLTKIKIKSTITMENGPQLIIQIVYALLTTSTSISSAVFLAFVGSFLSVIMAIASFYANKLSSKDSQFVSYYLQFKNNKELTLEQKENIENNKERKKALQKSIATQFNISHENIEIGYSTIINKGIEMRIVQFVPQSDLNEFVSTSDVYNLGRNNIGYNVSVKPHRYLMEMYKQYSNEINIVFQNHFHIDHDEHKFVVSVAISRENNWNEKQLSNKQEEMIEMMAKPHLSSTNAAKHSPIYHKQDNNNNNNLHQQQISNNQDSLVEMIKVDRQQYSQQFMEINEKLQYMMNHMGIDNNKHGDRERMDATNNNSNSNNDDIEENQLLKI